MENRCVNLDHTAVYCLFLLYFGIYSCAKRPYGVDAVAFCHLLNKKNVVYYPNCNILLY